MRQETAQAFADLSSKLGRDERALDKAFADVFSALETEADAEPNRECCAE